jgi:twitching motility protein PilT
MWSHSTVFDTIVTELIELNGSDLILSTGAHASARVDGRLRPIGGERMTSGDIVEIVRSITNDEQRDLLEEHRDLDFSFNWKNRARLRANVFYQRGTLALALRVLPYEIPTAESLGVPAAVIDWADGYHGLVLVTGPTGSGKSSTLAALVDRINRRRPVHIITIEDPIEYLYRHAKAVVNQREVGTDVPSFARGVRAALRENPDVILVGEMRDLETIQIAITAAETGHLVLATLHTNDVSQSIDRVIDVFPSAQQTQVRLQFANALVGIVHQQLLPRLDGGRVAAHEVLVATPAVRNLIREGKSGQIRNVVVTGSAYGMQTLETALNRLISEGVVTREEALQRSAYPVELGAV